MDMCVRRITEQSDSFEENIMNQAIDVLGIVLTSGKTHLGTVRKYKAYTRGSEEGSGAASRALVCVSPRMFHSVICE